MHSFGWFRYSIKVKQENANENVEFEVFPVIADSAIFLLIVLQVPPIYLLKTLKDCTESSLKRCIRFYETFHCISTGWHAKSLDLAKNSN